MDAEENSIEQDATHVLLHMAGYVAEGADQATRGHATWDAAELAMAVHLPATRLNDCIEILEESGYVDVLRHLGTREFSFGSVTLTSRGRVEAERLGRQSHSEHQAGRESMVLAPIPTGSPYGFTDEDWETVAAERDDGSRLIVVFGHQWESGYFGTTTLRRNIGEMFREALAGLPEHQRAGITLDYRPLAGGYGSHLFNEIARDIISSDIAVFETSDCNANVMIEMGVALTWGIRVLPIRKVDAPSLPSDISGQTWAIYADDGATWHDAGHHSKLRRMCERALAKKKRKR